MTWKGTIFDDTISSGTVSWNTTTATGVAQVWQYTMPVYVNGSKYSTKVYNDFNIKKEDKNMMGLYQVAAINTKTNKVFCDSFVAKNDSSAERKLIKKYPAIDEWDEDYLLIKHLWSVTWETQKPKEVKIVKE